MKTAELKNRLIVACYLHAKKIGFDRYFELYDAANAFNIEIPNGLLRVIAQDWRDSGIAKITFTFGGGADRGMHTQLTAYGIDTAEDLLESNPEFGEPVPIAGTDEIVVDGGQPQISGLTGGGVLGDPVFGSSGTSRTSSGSDIIGGSNIWPDVAAATEVVLASDRYVTVRDNQEPFDLLEKSLDDIVAEFAKDHGKNNVIQSEHADYLKTEISAVKAQIKQGMVSAGQLFDRLKPALIRAREIFSTIGGIRTAIEGALKALEWIRNLFS